MELKSQNICMEEQQQHAYSSRQQRKRYDALYFTHQTKDNYNAVDTKLTITVNKAAQAPNMPQAAMAPAHSTKKVGNIMLQDGWSWQEADKGHGACRWCGSDGDCGL